MAHHPFDLAKIARLDDPGRFDTLVPEVMWEALGVAEPRAIVDLGAGTGLFAARFAAMAPSATVYAVDVEPVMIEWMRDKRAEVASGRIVPVLSEQGSVPLDDGLADVVYSINVHHELPDPAAVYAEAFRLLRPGGRALVADWARRETPKGPPLEARAEAADVAEMLRAAGFAEVDEHAGLPWHWLLTGVRPRLSPGWRPGPA